VVLKEKEKNKYKKQIDTGLTCDPRHVFVFAPNCTLLKVYTEGVNFSQYLNLITALVVLFFLEYPFQISRFLGFLDPILLKLSSMVGLSNERNRKLISVRMSV